MFRRVVYVVPGFLQTAGSRSGLIDLWGDLHREHAAPDCRVELRPWATDWGSEAELVHRTSEPDARIVVVAFSWGAGFGFVQFAKALRRRGRRIKGAALIDPVYRHWYRLGNWRAFFPRIPIRIPSNVDRVRWWRQQQSEPRGHNLAAASKLTAIEPPIWIQVDHVHADDHPPTIVAARAFVRDLLLAEDTELR